MSKQANRNKAYGLFLTVLAMFFCSGAAALIYEVLWMKELGLLFGNTTYATSATLTALFLGLAAGGWVWGNRVSALENPLLIYGLLEVAIAISVVGYFLILDAYHQFYPFIFAKFGNSGAILVGIKFVLALLLLFPPAFFMGGTLPVMSHALVRTTALMGHHVAILYGTNTLGAALGAFFAGFYFPLWLGFEKTYILAIVVTVGVGVLAIILSLKQTSVPVAIKKVSEKTDTAANKILPMNVINGLCFLSGVVTLSLQVLWTRMFAQVLQNSVYTFSAILVVFLICLAVGAGIANRLTISKITPISIIFGLLTVSAVLVAISPFGFNHWTDGLRYVSSNQGWDGYVIKVLTMTFAVMGLPVVILGSIFPYLIKLAEPHADNTGRVVGRMVAINTVGAMAGSATAGFIILEYLGLWAGIRLMSILYLLVAIHLFYRYCDLDPRVAAVPLAGLLVVVSLLDISRLPIVRVDPVDEEEALLEVWEGGAGTVAVVRKKNQLKIKVNNNYTLGGSGSRELEALQGYLPVLLHPRPESVFFLGLGTGITAGAALSMPIRRLVAAELLPKVIEASNKYFGRYNNKLFYDKRATIIAEDARNYLSGTSEKYDVIIADLFIPWKAGTGSLYTVENYRSVHDRLLPGGLFMQWLPAYQLSNREFAIITRTMQAVFPQVTIWRGDFSAKKPIVGLLGQTEVTPLSQGALLFTRETTAGDADRVPILAHYVGNLKNLNTEFKAFPMNTDDRPVIEYQAPITQRIVKSKKVDWLVGEELIDFMARVVKSSEPENDPYLSELNADIRQLSRAGLYLHRAQIYSEAGRLIEAKDQVNNYQAILNSNL